jgi:hypothetical protein
MLSSAEISFSISAIEAPATRWINELTLFAVTSGLGSRTGSVLPGRTEAGRRRKATLCFPDHRQEYRDAVDGASLDGNSYEF